MLHRKYLHTDDNKYFLLKYRLTLLNMVGVDGWMKTTQRRWRQHANSILSLNSEPSSNQLQGVGWDQR